MMHAVRLAVMSGRSLEEVRAMPYEVAEAYATVIAASRRKRKR